jgi:recombination protein RecA
MKIGVMFGNPETTTGGNALKFYSSLRLDIRRIEAIKEGPDVIGSRVRVKVVKNKVAPPFKQAEFDVLFNEGISKWGEIVDLGVEHHLIEKSGTWYTYKEDRIGQGRDNAKGYLKQNPALAKEIEDRIKESVGLTKKSEEKRPVVPGRMTSLPDPARPAGGRQAGLGKEHTKNV